MGIAVGETEHGSAPGVRPPTARRGEFTIQDFLVSLFFHRRIIVLAMLVPFIVGIVLAIEARTQYVSTGLLMVLVNRQYTGDQNVVNLAPSVLTVEGLKSVEAEVLIIESADVIQATIAEVGADKLFPPSSLSRLLRWLPGFDPSVDDRDIERFRARLSATVEDGSNVVSVSFSHPDRDLAIQTTDTLIRIFLVRRKALFDNPTSNILDEEVERINRRLDETDSAIRVRMKEVNIIDLSHDTILAANQADSILQRTRQVSERLRAVEGQIAAAGQQQNELAEMVLQYRDDNNEAVRNGNVDELLVRLRAEREQLLSQYARSHPTVRQIERQIAVVENGIKELGNTAAWSQRNERNPSVSYVINMLISLRVEKEALDLQLAELELQRTRAQARIAELIEVEQVLRTLERERTLLTASQQEYVNRADAARIEEAAALVRVSNVRVVQSGKDGVVARNMALPLLAAGILAGILCGAAAGVCAAELRTSFLRPQEVERALGLPALASFSWAGADAKRQTFDSAANRQALQSMARHLLDIRIGERGLSAIQLVDVNAGDDKMALAEALAVELGEGRGIRVLAIGLQAEGFASGAIVRDSRIPAGDRVDMPGITLWRTTHPGVDIATVSDRSPLVDLLAPAGHAKAALDELSQGYDLVMIAFSAASPLVTQRLASAVDANILVVIAEHSRSPVAVWTRDIIFDAGGGIAGFVFTRRKFYVPDWVYKWL